MYGTDMNRQLFQDDFTCDGAMVGSIWDGRVFLYVQKLVQRHLVVLEQRGMHARCSRTTAVRELAATDLHPFFVVWIGRYLP